MRLTLNRLGFAAAALAACLAWGSSPALAYDDDGDVPSYSQDHSGQKRWETEGDYYSRKQREVERQYRNPYSDRLRDRR